MTALSDIFEVYVTDNRLHVVTAILGIPAAYTGCSLRFNQVFGIIYILLGLLGLIPALYFPAGTYGTDRGLFLGLMHINAGDHVLHLVVGIVAAAVGFFVADYVAGRVPADRDPMVRP